MYKIPLVGIREGWPWWLITAFLSSVVGWALYYNYAITGTGIDARGLVTVLGVYACFVALVAIRYSRRWKLVNEWNSAFHTQQGMAIVPTDSEVKGRLGALCGDSIYGDMDKAIADSIEFWLRWDRKKNPQSSTTLEHIVKVFEWGTLEIVSNPITSPTISYKMAGWQSANQIKVVFDGVRIPTTAVLLNLIRHEAGHVCLQALGVPDSTHHQLFNDSGYGA